MQRNKWGSAHIVCWLKLEDEPSWHEITGNNKYSNIIVGNIYSTDLIVNNIDR